MIGTVLAGIGILLTIYYLTIFRDEFVAAIAILEIGLFVLPFVGFGQQAFLATAFVLLLIVAYPIIKGEVEIIDKVLIWIFILPDIIMYACGVANIRLDRTDMLLFSPIPIIIFGIVFFLRRKTLEKEIGFMIMITLQSLGKLINAI